MEGPIDVIMSQEFTGEQQLIQMLGESMETAGRSKTAVKVQRCVSHPVRFGPPSPLDGKHACWWAVVTRHRSRLRSSFKILREEDWSVPTSAADVDKVLNAQQLRQRLSGDQVSTLRALRRCLEQRSSEEVRFTRKLRPRPSST